MDPIPVDFSYSLRRSDLPRSWELSSEAISVIRAACDSINRLPFALFERRRERVLVEFLSGDLLEAAIMRSLENEPGEVWLHRDNGRGMSSRIPLTGLSLRAFEALIYVAKLQIVRPKSDTRGKLDQALLFVMGFAPEVIESEGIPF